MNQVPLLQHHLVLLNWSEGESICLDPSTPLMRSSLAQLLTSITLLVLSDIRSSTAYPVGAQIQSRNRTESGTATRYLIINSIGEVSGHIAADPNPSRKVLGLLYHPVPCHLPHR